MRPDQARGFIERDLAESKRRWAHDARLRQSDFAHGNRYPTPQRHPRPNGVFVVLVIMAPFWCLVASSAWAANQWFSADRATALLPLCLAAFFACVMVVLAKDLGQ